MERVTQQSQKITLIGLAAVFGISCCAFAGDLEPDTGPAPTMKTLTAVEPRTAISSLPCTIINFGSYYLTGNLVHSDTTTDAITINVDNITIDLMGYSITGPSSGSKSGVYMNGRTNVEIRDGTIQSFGKDGIYEVSANGKAHRIINMRLLYNKHHGTYLSGTSNLIKDCTADGNDGHGIHAGSYSTVSGNIVCNNQSYGIYASEGSTVSGNTTYNNEDYGISVSKGCTVKGNTCSKNGDHGIAADYGSVVSNNTVYNNTIHGISAASGCMVCGNAAYLNQSNGITTGSGLIIIGNTAYYNQNYGIHLGGNSFVDQNTAYLNNQSGGGFTNIMFNLTCTFVQNHAP